MRANKGKRTEESLTGRLREWAVGGRALFLRRTAALMLALLAGMLALQPRPGPAADELPALTVARDLPPGHVLTHADLVVRSLPADLLPRATLRDSTKAVGRVLAGAARGGEVITDTRLVGPELTELTTGRADVAAVPVRLTEPGIADLLHPGRRVDIVTISPESGSTESGTSDPASADPGASVLAEHVPVLAVRPAGDRHVREKLVVVGLPQQQAATVAAASMIHSLTVTLR